MQNIVLTSEEISNLLRRATIERDAPVAASSLRKMAQDAPVSEIVAYVQSILALCPIGRTGDVLRVIEPWAVIGRKTGAEIPIEDIRAARNAVHMRDWEIVYKHDAPGRPLAFHSAGIMPACVARLAVRVTSVTVVRSNHATGFAYRVEMERVDD